MNTREFFSLILPESGIRYLADLKTAEGTTGAFTFFRHYPQEDIATMASAAMQMDDDGYTVYFACAGFAEPTQAIDKKTGEPRVNKRGQPVMEYRTQALATHARAMWVDIDCGEAKAAKGSGYATKKEAVAAVVQFVKAVGIPAPLVVDSGGGLHCYWPFSQDVPKDWWVRVSRVWRAVIQHFALRSDPARDVDIASVLRPVGTHNRKGDEPRRVRAINENVVVSDPAEFAKQLVSVCKQLGVKPAAVAPKAKGASINDDLMATSYMPSYAEIVVQHCGQLANFASVLGDVEEPVWRAALGLLKHAEDGQRLAHEWSSGHPEYNADDTQAKLDRWEAGPTTCAHFEQVNPDGCAGCARKGKVKSPIQLGYAAPEVPETPAAPVEVVNGQQVKHEAVPLPPGYREHPDGGVTTSMVDPDGVVHWLHFSRVLFQPVTRIRGVDGTYMYRCRVHKLDGSVRFIDLPASLTASPKLSEELAKYEIFMTDLNQAAKHMQAYFRDYAAYIAKHAAEVRTYETYGWHHDNDEFIIGDRCFSKDGTLKKVILTGNAEARLNTAFSATYGTAEDWIDGINTMYNRPLMEPLQYVVCSGFGSLLGVFQSADYKGIAVALTGAKTAKGKTTVCRAALTAFGRPDGMTISTSKGATLNARSAVMSTHRNIPVLIDELTNIDPEDLSNLLYATANGQDKLRMDSGARLREALTWNLTTFITANDDLFAKLASGKLNSQAESVRVFEISTRDYPIPQLPLDEVLQATSKINSSVGVVGEQFIKYVVQHVGEVQAYLSMARQLILDSAERVASAEYRFHRMHAECTLAAAHILHKLGIVQFDLNLLLGWLTDHLNRLCIAVENNTPQTEDSLHALVTALSSRTLVTYGFRTKRTDGVEEPLQKPRDEIVGRYVIGDKFTAEFYHGKLFLSLSAVKQWCVDNRVDWAEVHAEGLASGLIVEMPGQNNRVHLGKGTPISSGQSRVVCIDAHKLHGEGHLQLVAAVAKPSAQAANAR